MKTSFIPSFLESIVYWLYLNYFGLAVRQILLTPLFPSSTWDSTLLTFSVSFIIDYFWRRFLSVGNVTDPSIIVILYTYKKATLGDIFRILTSCILAGMIVFFITEAVFPITYASWHRSRGLIFCFLFELCCDFIHQARNAASLLAEAYLIELKLYQDTIIQQTTSSGESFNKNYNKEQLNQFKKRGVQAVASFITASLVAFGSYFSSSGPMLTISYTVMAALSQRDWEMFFILGSANLLAGYIAGLYVSLDSTHLYYPLTIVDKNKQINEFKLNKSSVTSEIKKKI